MNGRPKLKNVIPLIAASALLSAAACTHHTVHIDPIEVKPMTLNINIRVQKELDEFFDFDQPVTRPSSTESTSSRPEGATQ